MLYKTISESVFMHEIIGSYCCYSITDSVPSPDHTDMRSPSEVSSGVNMDTVDKLPSPSDSGTASPNHEVMRESSITEAAINGKYCIL